MKLQPHHSNKAEVFSSTLASYVPLSCKVGSHHALIWRTKLSHCRGLQTSSWLQCTIKSQHTVPADWCNVRLSMNKRSKKVQELGSWIPAGHTSRFLYSGECTNIHLDFSASSKPECQPDGSKVGYHKQLNFSQQPNAEKMNLEGLWTFIMTIINCIFATGVLRCSIAAVVTCMYL